MSLDQTPLKYIPAMNHTMVKQNSKSVSTAGLSDKCSITGTFTITLNSHFLPMQLIYGGKQSKASLGLSFPMVSRQAAILSILAMPWIPSSWSMKL